MYIYINKYVYRDWEEMCLEYFLASDIQRPLISVHFSLSLNLFLRFPLFRFDKRKVN